MGSSKKYTAGHKYLMGQHQVILNGPIDYISRITFDGDKVAWRGRSTGGTITVAADKLFGGDDAEGGAAGNVDILMGKPGQSKNSYLQSMLGTAIPAFRGVVSLVFRQFYFGNSPYLKSISYRATRTDIRDEDGKPQWYLPKAKLVTLIDTKPQAYYFAVDNSGSMDTVASNGLTRIQNIKNALHQCMDAIAENITGRRVDICVMVWGRFASDKPRIIRRECDAADIAAIKNFITTQFNASQNATFFSGAWEYVLEFFEDLPADTVRNVFFITDGEPNDGLGTDPMLLAETARSAIEFYMEVLGAQLSIYAVNVDLANTYYTEVVDNSPDDGVPVVNAGEPQALINIVLAALAFHVDMNPIHILRECITSPVFGLSLSDADINDDAFTAAADQLFSENMGMSLLWDSDSMSLDSFMDEICRHIDASHYVDQDGRITIKLIRDDYDIADLITLDESNVLRVDSAASTPSTELVNSVTGIYWNPATGKDASITVSDPALVQMQGRVKNTTIQYPGFTNLNVVTRRLASDLRTLSNSLFSCTLVVNRVPESLNIGFPFIFNWPELDQYHTVMRIVDIDWGDGRNNDIRISCTQDVFGLPDVAAMAPSPGWENPSKPPAPAPARLAIELPYYELVQAQGHVQVDSTLASDPNIGIFGIAAIRPSSNAINAEIYANAGAGFDDAGYLDFCPSFTLTAAMDKFTDTIEFANGVDLDLITPNSLAQIDDELISITAIDLATGTATVTRCVLDSPIQNHEIGARVIIFDQYIQTDETEYVDGESIAIKVLPITGNGQLPLTSAPTDTVIMGSRAIRPYAPGQVTINGEYWPDAVEGDVIVNWSHRNRLQQTGGVHLGFYHDGVTPEDGTTYVVYAKNNSGTIVHQSTELSANTYTIPQSELAGMSSILVGVRAVRDGFASYSAHEHQSSYDDGAAEQLAFGLTYDEKDATNAITLTRLGSGPHITDVGFVGNGYDSRYTLTELPEWVSTSAGALTLHATVTPLQGPRNATRDVLVSVANASAPKLQLAIVQDPKDSTLLQIAARTYDTANRIYHLARRDWRFELRYPLLSSGGYTARPQGIAFLNATTLLITAHYGFTHSYCHKVDLTTGSVTGSFLFETADASVIAPKIGAVSQRADGSWWFTENQNKVIYKIDLDASFASGKMVILYSVNVGVLNSNACILWHSIGGNEYLLIGEYAETATAYLYAYTSTYVDANATFTVAGRYKRFVSPQKTQGLAYRGGTLFVSSNRLTTSTAYNGRVYTVNIDSMLASSSDGAVISPINEYHAASAYPEDLAVHPITGDIWMPTEGLTDFESHPGFLSIWSSACNGSAAENHFTLRYDTGSLVLKVNNRLFDTVSVSPTIVPDSIAIGGPATATAGQQNGFCIAMIKNIVIQRVAMGDSAYAAAVGGTHEENSLTKYVVALNNPGAESGVTGWTNEVGSLDTRNSDPLPHSGSAYFNGGSNAQTIARQRHSLLTVTGMSASEIDAATMWARVGWWQTAWDNTSGTATDEDLAAMGVRCLGDSNLNLQTTYGGLIRMIPRLTWFERAVSVNVPLGTRSIDTLYRSDRQSGTNNDGRIDDITLVIYKQ